MRFWTGKKEERQRTVEQHDYIAMIETANTRLIKERDELLDIAKELAKVNRGLAAEVVRLSLVRSPDLTPKEDDGKQPVSTREADRSVVLEDPERQKKPAPGRPGLVD